MLRLGLFCIYLCLIVGLVFLETVQLPFSIKQGFQWNGLNSILGINNIVPFYGNANSCGVYDVPTQRMEIHLVGGGIYEDGTYKEKYLSTTNIPMLERF